MYGMLYSITAYNVFCISTLAFIAQLESPPGWVYERERCALRKVLKGPGQWAKPEDLWHLKDAYGFAYSCKSLEWLAIASQLRVYLFDPALADERERRDLVSSTRKVLGCTDMLYTRGAWRDWFERCFILRLDDNYREFVTTTCTLETLESLMEERGRAPHGPGGQPGRATNNSFQGAAYELLCRKSSYDAEDRIRAKQKRWKLHEQPRHPHVDLRGKRGTPAWQAERTLHNLHELSSLVAPRVWSAVFSTIWNRWTTARRFQRRNTSDNVCVLQCSPTAEDSTEHYSRCSHAQQLAVRCLRLDPRSQVNLHTFNLCNPHITTQESLVASAVLIYSMYRATNYFRRRDIHTNAEIYEALRQWTREAVMGHGISSRILGNIWSRYRSNTPLFRQPRTHSYRAKRAAPSADTAAGSICKRQRM